MQEAFEPEGIIAPAALDLNVEASYLIIDARY